MKKFYKKDLSEELGNISKGDHVLETTSGSAGISFAAIGKRLGYKCHVAMPEDFGEKRANAIKDHGAELIPTEKGKALAGFTKFLEDHLPNHPEQFFLNHSRGEHGANNEVTLKALADIAQEVLEKESRIHYFVPGIGNGSSVLGPGRVFREIGTAIYGFEHFQSAVAYDMKYPGKYKEQYGIDPGTLKGHKLLGTSFQGVYFPHLKHAVDKGVLDKIYLVSDAEMDTAYSEKIGPHEGGPWDLPHWDQEFEDTEDFGRTTLAGLAVALDVAKLRSSGNSNILIIWYDKASRYDS